jgi:triosephosphate isomerase
MKKLFIVANWKSNKNTAEANAWIQTVNNSLFSKEEKEPIVCPPFTLLPLLKSNLKPEVKIGSQDISSFEKGAYTGAVNAEQVKEFAEYSIIGHSERRTNFAEDDVMLAKKVEIALKFGITPIFCVQGKETTVPEGVEIVAYEPVFAIGSGHPDTPEDAEDVAHIIKEKNLQVKHVLYGGSVNKDDVHTFTQLSSVDGVLVGGASLDPEHFISIINNA